MKRGGGPVLFAVCSVYHVPRQAKLNNQASRIIVLLGSKDLPAIRQVSRKRRFSNHQREKWGTLCRGLKHWKIKTTFSFQTVCALGVV
jgi:hypothetical protein